MSAKDGQGPYSIGSTIWPGISKLIEECGEVLQIAGKLLGTGGSVEHWDGGPDLGVRLESELGDLLAAIYFVAGHCPISYAEMATRATEKRALFNRWHEAALARVEPKPCCVVDTSEPDLPKCGRPEPCEVHAAKCSSDLSIYDKLKLKEIEGRAAAFRPDRIGGGLLPADPLGPKVQDLPKCSCHLGSVCNEACAAGHCHNGCSAEGMR